MKQGDQQYELKLERWGADQESPLCAELMSLVGFYPEGSGEALKD